MSLYIVYSSVTLPRPQNELPCMAKLLCLVPVQWASITDVLFSPLAPVAEVSPLCLDQFQLELRHHPNRSAVVFVISGIRKGFRIGFEPSSVSLKSASSNMRSSLECPFVIDPYLQSEVSARRVAGPFSSLRRQLCTSAILEWYPRIISRENGIWSWTCPHPRGTLRLVYMPFRMNNLTWFLPSELGKAQPWRLTQWKG